MATALVTQIAYAVQTLFDPAGTAGRLVDLGKLANYGLLGGSAPQQTAYVLMEDGSILLLESGDKLLLEY